MEPALDPGVAEPEERPRHAGLQLWLAVHGYQIAGRPASWLDWCKGKDD